MKKKTWTSIAALAICLAVLVGCSVNDNASPEGTGAQTPVREGENEGASANGDSIIKASAEPATATIFYFDPRIPFTGDLPVPKKAAELTNVFLENVAPTGGEEPQAYNLMLAGGELPDIITYKIPELNTVALEGALRPLDDLIEQHAPNLKRFLDERPDVRNAVKASDGNMYVVPFVMDGQGKEGWFIRQDWLDALKLSVPTTVDEYYNVLKAFKEQDPNGNKKKDEIPFFSRNVDIGVYGLLPLWDAFHDFYLDGATVHFGPYEPSYKDGMSNIAKWYREGLIDKEIFTRGNQARDELFANNTGGAVHDWFASTSNYNTSMASTVPGFSLLPIAPPASVSGKAVEVTKRDTLNGYGWSISTNAEDAEMLIKYFDFWWTEEGRRLLNFGIEGQTYTMKDGKPAFTEEVLNQPSVVDYLISDFGAQVRIGAWQDFTYEEQWANKIAVEGIKMYQDNGYIDPDFQLPVLNFTQEEQNRLKEILPSIQTYVKETSQKWIMGGEPVEANFESYIGQLEQMNMDEVLRIYQAAYDRYKQ